MAPPLQVGDVDGVRIGGVLLQAGPLSSAGAAAPVLLECPPQRPRTHGTEAAAAAGSPDARAPHAGRWGTGAHQGSASAPGMLHDVFARVGGPDGTASSRVGVQTMIHVRSGHVVGDNMWLWRADHAATGAVTYDGNACDHGLVVDGDDVTMYGLAVEHT